MHTLQGFTWTLVWWELPPKVLTLSMSPSPACFSRELLQLFGGAGGRHRQSSGLLQGIFYEQGFLPAYRLLLSLIYKIPQLSPAEALIFPKEMLYGRQKGFGCTESLGCCFMDSPCAWMNSLWSWTRKIWLTYQEKRQNELKSKDAFISFPYFQKTGFHTTSDASFLSIQPAHWNYRSKSASLAPCILTAGHWFCCYWEINIHRAKAGWYSIKMCNILSVK